MASNFYETIPIFDNFAEAVRPENYRESDLVANADFRKFDDGLRMTLDCSADFADKLEARLSAAEDFANWAHCARKPRK